MDDLRAIFDFDVHCGPAWLFRQGREGRARALPLSSLRETGRTKMAD
jgi:hypothetical protein